MADFLATIEDGDGVRRKRLDTYGTIHYGGNDYEVNLGTGTNKATVITKQLPGIGPTRRLQEEWRVVLGRYGPPRQHRVRD